MGPNQTTSAFEFQEDVIDSVLDLESSTGGKRYPFFKPARTKEPRSSFEEDDLVDEIVSTSRKEFSREYVYSLRKYYAEKIQVEFRKLQKRDGDASGALYYSQIKDIIREIYERFVYLPSEEGFLHIIGLINSSIVENRWRQYSDEQARRIEDALKICFKSEDIAMKDVLFISKKMGEYGIDTMPIE